MSLFFNESCICEQAIPPLSSVTPDFESGGYAAAETPHALMCGEPALRCRSKNGDYLKNLFRKRIAMGMGECRLMARNAE